MLTDSRKIGPIGEAFVANWLQEQGYRILAQNYRCKFGEIDLIASRAGAVCFVEVKTRQSNYFDLSEVITPLKRKKLIASAKDYVGRNNILVSSFIFQFDVALLEKELDRFTIRYLPNAFYANEFN